jgi:hypothetical protein
MLNASIADGWEDIIPRLILEFEVSVEPVLLDATNGLRDLEYL